MQEVWFGSMKTFIKSGNVIVAEYTINGNTKQRTIVVKCNSRKGTISTIHGDLTPDKMYAVSSLEIAKQFVEEGK